MANAMSKAVKKVIARQRRKQALAKAGSALKTAGKAVAALGATAGIVIAIRAVARNRAEDQVVDRKSVV